ncbi:AraC-type DNA-binding protein [Nannocystis exedens]|uniref:AraC-type DNA-binding protein n=1 Tax=Nannocystis exedens TaxID=54 RepID=A0A1I1UDA1_9BACT|nr:AraC family transcriptional regulator [Nannocystis exedens]PCC71613.1 Arabinose operon regulatory protein [Nannocystis exedens]SFD68717.1 AraC-type DNA-binding protein [Nannocystis exedens]
MPALLHHPGPPLGEFVDCFWAWECYTGPAPRERALPSGTVDIVINLRDDSLRVFDRFDRASRFPGIMVSGAHAGYFVIDTAPCAAVMGVHFRPGGAAPFLGVSAGELTGGHFALEALWGATAARLRERLLAAAGPGERFRLLERFLLARLARPPRRHPAVTYALRAFDDPDLGSVAEVLAHTGLSAKRLLALFRDEVGLAPKAFWRVRRLQAALRRLDGGGPVRGADLAAELGYCDQSHFDREFRELTGLSPRAYRAQGVERPNHVPLRG